MEQLAGHPTVTISRPFRAHHTIVLAMPLPSPRREVTETRPKNASVLVDGQGLVWLRNGGTDSPRPNQPSIPVGGLSSLASPTRARSDCPLPRHRAQVWHPGPDQGC